jgi:ubiquinone biosynthesis protein
VFATGLTAVSTTVADWVPITFGALAALLTFGLIIDLVRRH